MKKLFIIIIPFMVMSSCTSTKEARSEKAELRKEKKATEQYLVKNAVETKRYIIKLDRIYFSHGGIIDLVPRANFIIIDGEKAVISTAYVGRQYDIKPIVGINMRGRTIEYTVTNNSGKGSYDIAMKINNGKSTSFSVNLTITSKGYCNASIRSLKIDNVRYSGYLVPLSEKASTPPEDKIVI